MDNHLLLLHLPDLPQPSWALRRVGAYHSSHLLPKVSLGTMFPPQVDPGCLAQGVHTPALRLQHTSQCTSIKSVSTQAHHPDPPVSLPQLWDVRQSFPRLAGKVTNLFHPLRAQKKCAGHSEPHSGHITRCPHPIQASGSVNPRGLR